MCVSKRTVDEKTKGVSVQVCQKRPPYNKVPSTTPVSMFIYPSFSVQQKPNSVPATVAAAPTASKMRRLPPRLCNKRDTF